MNLLSIIAASRRRGSAFDPLSLTPALWLDASDADTLFDATSGGSTPTSGNDIARWEDKSGNDRHITQATPDRCPHYQTAVQNGLAVARFDGSNDYLDSAAIAAFNTDIFTDVFVGIFRTPATYLQVLFRTAYTGGTNIDIAHGAFRQTGNLIYHARTTAAGFIGSSMSGGAINTPFILSGRWAENNTVTAYIDGEAATAATLATLSPSGHIRTRLGANSTATPGAFAQIDVCEWLRFTTDLSTTDRQAVESYLAAKWGITI